MKFLAALLSLVVFAHAAPDVVRVRILSGTDNPTGDFAFEVDVNPDNQKVFLRFNYAIKPPVNPPVFDPATAQIDKNVPISNREEDRPFNLVDLAGGNTYVFRAEATAPTEPAETAVVLDAAEIEFTLNPYGQIELRNAVVTRPTNGGSPTARLTAKVTGSGGTVTAVRFQYGERAGDYTESKDGAKADGTTTGDGEYSATVPVDGDELRRGFVYHYQVEVDTAGNPTPTRSADATFTTPANTAPVAGSDSVRLQGDQSILINVLANDRDPDGDGVSLIAVTQGKQGKVSIEGNQVRYTPIPDASGGDSFTYTIRDDYTLDDDPATTDVIEGTRTATGTVTINAPSLKSRGWHAAEIKDEEGNVVGYLRLYGTGEGAVTGKLQLHTQAYTLQGEIRADGHFYYTIPRENDDPLQLDVDFGAGEESTFEAFLQGGEDAWTGTSTTNTLTDKRRDEVVGRYTVEFPAPGGDDDALPQGNGFARVDVKPWGEVSVRGKLGDGTKFSTKGVLTGDGENASFGIWITPKQNRIGANFTFGGGLEPNVSGEMKWYREPDRNANLFPDGFYVDSITPSGSRFVSEDNHRSLPGSKKATITLTDGNLNTTITQGIEITKSDKVIVLGSNPFGVTLKIDRETGLFKGQFDHPFDDSRRKFQGALVQSQNKGSGVFIGIDRTGSVSLTSGLPAAPVPTPTPNPNPDPDPDPNPNIPGFDPNDPRFGGVNIR